MARVIEEFPATTRQSKYPWDEWTDGQIWELEAGKDFTQQIESMRQAAAKQAKQRNLAFRTAKVTRDKKDYLVLQFLKIAKTKPTTK